MIPFTAHPRRSLIFMPGNRPTLFPKALGSGADIVCVDLEDAIAPQDKEEARANTFPLFADHDTGQGPECMVRINCLRTAEGLADLLALLECDQCPPALMLTKTKSADEIRVYEELLAGAGHAPRLHVIVETNQALEACHEIAHASDTLDSLLFGGVDMAAELRVEPSWEGLRYARARVVRQYRRHRRSIYGSCRHGRAGGRGASRARAGLHRQSRHSPQTDSAHQQSLQPK